MLRCLKVVLKEEVEHHRYVVSDLAALVARPEPGEGGRLRRRATRPLPLRGRVVPEPLLDVLSQRGKRPLLDGGGGCARLDGAAPRSVDRTKPSG